MEVIEERDGKKERVKLKFISLMFNLFLSLCIFLILCGLYKNYIEYSSININGERISAGKVVHIERN